MIKRIVNDEIHNYILLDRSDPKYLDKAVAFTRSPINNDGWEEIEYYGKPISTSFLALEEFINQQIK